MSLWYTCLYIQISLRKRGEFKHRACLHVSKTVCSAESNLSVRWSVDQTVDQL